MFQASYIHTHWHVMKNWNFNNIKERCVFPREDGEQHHDEEHGDDQGGNDDDDYHSADVEQQAGGISTGVQYLPGHEASILTNSTMTPFVKSEKRYMYAKTLFDEVASQFASHDLFSSFVGVIRTVIVTCKSGDPNAGFARIKSYITVDPRLQKLKEPEPTLLPAVNVKTGRKKNNSRGKMAR
jgi:hypothetical protein